MFILFLPYCLTTLLHQVCGQEQYLTLKTCSKRLITNPANHKQNTRYSPHKRNVLYIKLAHSSHLQGLYISKLGSWYPCSLVGDGYFGEHAVFTIRKAVTKVTLLRIFTTCRLNSSTQHKNQVTQ